MKRFLNVIAITLALNFVAVIGGVGWLWRSGRLDGEKVHAIREVVFPTTAPTTQAVNVELADGAPTRPMLKLEELLERQAGRPATEQVAYMQRAFDAQMAQLDRRQRELVDLQRQVDLAQEKLSKDRAAYEVERKGLAAREEETARLQADKGFQDSLELYKTMQPKQVKEIFMTLEDAAVEHYLTAMEPRAAGKIIKEFKTPQEIQRVQTVMEKIRQAPQPAAAEPQQQQPGQDQQQKQADASAKG